MPKQYRQSNVVCCELCGEPFVQRPRSPQQQCCHPKCKDRARSRRKVPKFWKVPMGAAPLTAILLMLREFIFANQPNGAIGYVLRSHVLGAYFPLPLLGGRRKTFVGRRSDLPYFELGGVVRDGTYIPWEPPRVPIEGVYDLIYVLPAGVTILHGPVTLSCSQNMISDSRVRSLIEAAKAAGVYHAQAAPAPAFPAGEPAQEPESVDESENEK